MAEYEQEKSQQKDHYKQANEKWPYLSEYGEQFVIGRSPGRFFKTE